jgi:thioredoxin 2
MAAPEIHALAQEMAGQAIILKVNTDQFPELGSQFRVQSIPNFVVLANGRTVLQRSGVAPRSEMRRWIEQAMATA